VLADIASSASHAPKRSAWRRLAARHLLVAATLTAAFTLVPVRADDPFFGGKALKIIVGMPPGGGVDAYARLVQRHLGSHLAGAPSIVVQNMPGAGSLRSVIALTTLPDDGTVVGTFSSSLITEAITAPERVKVDFRNFAFLGNASEDVRVCYVRGATGVRNWQDLRARDQITFGATAPGTSGNVDTAMLRNLFGIRLKQVQGYAGSADKRLALEKGEIDGDCGGWTAIPEDWLRGHKINILLRLSPTRVSGLDHDIPFGGDLLTDDRDRKIYELLIAPQRLGRLFMVSGKAPVERVTLLRKAFDAMLADPAFLAEAQKLGLLVMPMPGEEVDRHVSELYATPPELLRRARSIIAE
jgi:tripartite-type tricarboxylate transporter receptor subunit TctC